MRILALLAALAAPIPAGHPVPYTIALPCTDGEVWVIVAYDPELIIDYVLVTQGRINSSQFKSAVLSKYPAEKDQVERFLRECLTVQNKV